MPARDRRRLAAILAADVVGFSRLMEADEAGTLERLKAARQEVVDPHIAEFGGRTVKTTGDGMLCEFPSAVAAVECAAEVQRTMAARKAGEDQRAPLQFRVGINLGDILVEGDDIFGDGVNVAARLESVSQPGGIAISGEVHTHLKGRAELDWFGGDEQQLKNLSRPVAVWLWHPEGEGGQSSVESATLTLPDKPSIAVLPFDNFSDHPDQAFFADGIAEDIITALSRLRGFFVIARNSTFTYKGKSVDVAQVARELGVRYVLEGSIRRAGSRLRLTAQLIDGISGAHLWAERFDGDLTDVFALQDEITHKIVSAINPALIRAEADRLQTKPPKDLEVWACMTRALTSFWRWTKSDFEEAERLLRKALALEADNAECLGLLARVRWSQATSGFVRPGREAMKEALDLAERAVVADEGSARAHGALALVLNALERFPDAVSEAERAVELAPGSSEALLHAGLVHSYAGPQKTGVEELQQSLRLNPRDPMAYARYQTMAVAHFVLGEYETALELTRRVTRVLPEWIEAHTFGIACLSQLGRLEEAREEATAVLERWPHYSSDYAMRRHPFRDKDARRRLGEALRSAGLP